MNHVRGASRRDIGAKDTKEERKEEGIRKRSI
jgi:hypothetical protein